MARVAFAGGEDAGGAAALANSANRLVDQRFHFRIGDLAGMAHRGMQVRRTDEHAVNAIYGTYRLDVTKCRLGFYLHQHADLFVRALRIVLDPAEARRARRARDAAHAGRWVTGVRNRALRLRGRRNIRHQKRLGADVEHALHRHHVVPGNPHHRVRGIWSRGLQLAEQVLEVGRRMLSVEQDPVEARPGDYFDTVIRREARPEADLRCARLQRTLEAVLRQLHVNGSPARE